MLRAALSFILVTVGITVGSVPLASAQNAAIGRTTSLPPPSVAPPSGPIAPAAARIPGPIAILPSTAPADSSTPPPDAVSLPLRLSIISSVFPVGHGLTNGGCGEKSVAAAGTIFPTQPVTQVRLTPRLVLHGFSDLGCPGDGEAPLDAGAGAGLTYAAPLRRNLWLVGSAGGYAIPRHDQIPARSTAAGGLDLVVKKQDGGTLSTGLGVLGKGADHRVMVRGGGTF